MRWMLYKRRNIKMVRFIAEIGSNHNRDINRTLALIEEAKRIGCWAVKFQLFEAEKLYAPAFKTQIEKMKKWELPTYFIPDIKRRCKKLGLKFICTPFHLEAVNFLNDYVDYFKIGSYENQWFALINSVAKTGKPWMVSTGMIDNIFDIGEVNKSKYDFPFVIFHCNSNYPAKPENCNLGVLSREGSDFRVMMGWSDHTVKSGVIYKAISLGAEYIEFHFDLEDGKGFESEAGHCWKPSQIKEVIDNVKIGDIAEQENDTEESEARKWRTDPIDGLRPLKQYRGGLLNK